jgi:hypothetical protein
MSISVAPIVIPIVVLRPGYANVHAACVAPVVVDDVDAGMAPGAVAESVAFAAGQAQGSDGQNHD